MICVFNQKTRYLLLISGWISDVCSSDLIACVSENGGRQRARLRARVAMMRLIEEITDHRIFKHAGIHLPHDVQSMRFQRGDSGFDKRDGLAAESLRHHFLL